MGAFICTLSENDWEATRKQGIYGNRLYKEGTRNILRDVQILSIIRDLIPMKKGDTVFFHIRGKRTIHGVYKVKEKPYYDEERIWENDIEYFPFRFLFEPYPHYRYLAEYDANIDVHSLYEFIDKGKIKSLVTLENEQNIEARGVRKILTGDAEIIINQLHRDFKRRKSAKKLNFEPYNLKQNITYLKDRVYKVGSVENAIKAIFMHELSFNLKFVRELFDDKNINLTCIDFINEFFIAQSTRRSVDIYCLYNNIHLLVEAKTKKADINALKQILYYRDILFQRPWINPQSDKINVMLIAKDFPSDLIKSIERLNEVNNGIRLMKYTRINDGKWGQFKYVY